MKDVKKVKRRSSFPSKESTVRVAVLGEASVGKSALTVQFVCGRFLSEYDPTLEDTYTKEINVAEKRVKLHVLDTAGFDEEDAARSLHREAQVRANDAFVVVYSETDRCSFDSARALLELVARSRPNAPVALVANKSDLAQFRVVAETEGRALAAETACTCHFFRTSAAQGHDQIDSVMDHLVRAKWARDAEKALAHKKRARIMGRSVSIPELRKTILRWVPKFA
ncbi:ras-related protein Rap-2a-like [Oscarella lobularis]|uniref:ras-related protein Rap-2a-like n=1 Tax=Oscarella lobularis TaxID=121494 RepID=UPI003313F2D9